MKQKLLPLCVALLALVLCNTPLFAEDFAVDGIYYNITSDTDKSVAVTYRGSNNNSYSNEYSGAVTIPESVTYSGSTYSVTSIGDAAFSRCSSLTSVVIPNSVTSIGDGAFGGCSSLTSVEIPNSVTSIGDYAFYECSSLTSVEIPNSVTSIGERVFYDCDGLTSVEIPNSVTNIGDEAFCSCSGLTSVEIPNSVTSIGPGAFSDCSSLTSVVIPNSVISIGGGAFRDCSSLTSVVIPNSVTSIGDAAFRNCSSLTSVVIPNSVTSIGDSAFYECDGLTSVVIPNSVTSIGSWAFYNCSSLTSVEIPNSVTSIGSGAFRSCSGLTSVEIPNSVTSIGSWAFEYCSSLTSVVIPNSVTRIWDDAFRYCASLTTATVGCSWKTNPLYDFGSGVTVNATLHSYENGSCTVCHEKSLPFEVDGIYYNITSEADKTVEVTFRGSNHYEYSNEYSGSVTIPESVTYGENTYSVTTIGNYAFYACHSLTSITIPNSVLTIGESAFSYCSGLTSINIPNSVTTIGESAFRDCEGLTSIIIPNGVTTIREWTFMECTGLTSITLPNSLTTIGDYAFPACTSLTSITLPNSLTTIGVGTFQYCPSLTSITIPNSVTSIGTAAFEYCDRLKTATVGCSWKTNPLYDFGSGVTVNATLHSYENGICTVCGDKEFPTITYIVDGVVYATIQQKAGETPKLPEPPTKEGYTFKGWKNLPEVMPGEDITVEAEFTINTYEITYVIDDAVFAKQSVTYGEKITPPDVPEKEGCSFSGWKNLPTTMPAHDVTVTGTFSENSYTLTYVIDGEIFQTETKVFGATINPPTAPEKEGYRFSGWKNLPETMPAHDLEIHGTYSKQHYLLTFILDGKVLQQGTVEYGAVITTPSVPAKEGHTFAGWDNLPATMPAHDVTVYGTYDKQEYLLTFIADGEVVQQRYVEYGEKIVPPAAPEKEGHAFDGWKDVPETMPARDLEIQGTYHKQSYLLIFVVDDKVIQQDYVEFGTVITTPAAPTKKGHSFAGWENLPTTMPAHDVTVKGLYEVNTYLLRIYLNGALYQTMAVDYGTVLDIPVPTVPEDMEFKGWTTEIPATMPAHDLDIYGTYDYPTSIASLQANQRVTIYTLNGLLICKDAQWQTVKDKLAAGMYIVNGKKIFVKTEQ